MKTHIQFQDPSSLSEAELVNRIKAKNDLGQYLGAVVYDDLSTPNGEYKGIVHVGNPYADRPTITSLYTRISKAQFEQVRDSAVWMEETCAMFELLASNYHTRSMLMFEGESSLGKTFCSELFFRFLYGPNFDPLKVTVDQFMEGKDLLAKWVPRDPSRVDLSLVATVDQYLDLPSSQQERLGLESLQKQLTGLDRATIDKILNRFKINVAERIGLINEGGDWVRESGEVVKSMTGSVTESGEHYFPEEGGAGIPLLVDELSRGKPSVTNVFLGIRGKGRSLVERLPVLDLGKTVKRGENAFIVFTQNPTGEDFEGTNPIDPALARALIYVRMKPMSNASYNLFADCTLRFKTGGRPHPMPSRQPFNYEGSRELISELAEILFKFHMHFKATVSKEYKNREQKIPTTLDDMSSFAKQLYLHPVRSSSGSIDVGETVRDAVKNTYLLQLQNEEKLSKGLTKYLDDLLKGPEIGAKRFRGKVMIREKILQTLVGELELDPQERVNRNKKAVHDELGGMMKDSTLPNGVRDALGELGSLIN